ncbi:unnamed protein product, partial [Brassica rapa subsp. narinosa]
MASSAPYWPAYLHPIIVSSPMLAFNCLSSLLVRFDLELPVSGVFWWSARLNAPSASFWPVTWVTFSLLCHMSSSFF